MKDILAVNKAIFDRVSASEVTLSQKFDTLNETVSSLRNEMSDVQKDIKQLNGEVEICSSQVQILENEVASLKQQQLQNDIVISGFPSLNYNVDDVLKKITQLLQFDTNNIVQSYKKEIKGKNHSNSEVKKYMHIVATFKTNLTKTEFLIKLRKNGPLFLDQLFPNEQNKQQIYINERMTSANVILLKAIQQLKKEKKVLHVWFRNGKIYTRAKEGDHPILINTNDDIIKLVA